MKGKYTQHSSLLKWLKGTTLKPVLKIIFISSIFLSLGFINPNTIIKIISSQIFEIKKEVSLERKSFLKKALQVNSYKNHTTLEVIQGPQQITTTENIASGSLVIPMDNNYQNLGSTSSFNLKGYGLVVHLLHAGIPVKWVIATGKTKDGIDFTANAQQAYPSTSGSSSRSFRSGPFIIYPGYEVQAAVVINSFNNGLSGNDKVNVYELTQSVNVDVKHTLTHKPKAALLNNGGNDDIHEDYMQAAGLSSGTHYDKGLMAAQISSSSCYTFISEAHADENDVSTSEVNNVRLFVQNGGNFLAQCAAGRAYENLSASVNRLVTQSGVTDPGIGGNIIFDNSDDSYAQTHGALENQGGSAKSYKPSGGYISGTNIKRYAYDSNDGNNFKAYGGKAANVTTTEGGHVFYLAGHNYNSNGIGNNNGRRMYLNAFIVPAERPSVCNLNLGPIAADDNGTINGCGQSTTIDIGTNDSNPLGGTLTYNLLSNGTYGTFVNNGNGTVTYTLSSDYFSGTDAITYEACNAQNTCAQATITVSGPNNLIMSGNVFGDQNQNTNYDNNESGQNNVTVNLYEDVNSDGQVDGGDNFVNAQTTSNGGQYTFTLNANSVTPSQVVNITNQAISSSSDDSYQKSDNKNYPTSYESGDVRWKGYRFTNLNIPSNAVITNVELTLTGYSNGNTTATVTAENTSNPSAYSNAKYYLSTRSTTSNSESWSIPSLSNGTILNSPNLKDIVQEVVDNNSGATHLSLIISSPAKWIIWNYDDGSASKFPKLNLTYQIPGNTVDYVIEVDNNSLPNGYSFTTDNVETASFIAVGQIYCNNDFGIINPCDPVSSGNTDTDNDGIADICDNDDDNDGILDTDEGCGAVSAGTGTSVTTISGSIGDANNILDGINNAGAKFNAVNETLIIDLGQVVPSGRDVSLAYFGKSNVSTKSIEVSESDATGSTTVNPVTITTNNIGVAHNLDYTLSADTRYIKLKMTVRTSGRIEVDYIEYQSFNQCLDFDNDGITNNIDLDSDNDGCPDALEGGANFSFSQIQSDSSLVGNIDSDGIPTIANGGQAIGTSQNSAQQSLVCICIPSNLDTTIINLTTCDVNAVSTTTQTLTSQAGCDSTVITNTTFNGGPSNTVINLTTCDANLAGTVNQTLTNQAGCDSLVITNTTFNGGPNTTTLNLTTCDVNLAGTTTEVLTNQAGCDSTVITNTTYNGGPETTTVDLMTCDANLVGTTTQTLTAANGCDSTVITNTTFNGGPNTTTLNLTTCDVNLAGTTTEVLTNQAGCDSTVITNTTYNGGPETTTVDLMTCDINSVGSTTQTLTAANGCDSLVTTNITLNTIQAQAQCPGFRTQAQGGWGANPNGNNPGVYLHANFVNAFPNGLVVGCNNTLTLTSAQAVTNFLPSGGGPQALSANFVDPTSNKGTFAAQVVALTISVGFDNYDANFGTSSYNLEDLIIQSGTFTGWTVQQLLIEANLALGDCTSLYSRSTLNDAVDNVNQSYVDGTASGSFLGCPPCISLSHTSVDPSCALTADGSINLTVNGGVSPYTYSWLHGANTADLTSLATGVYIVTVTDINGITGVEIVTLTAPLFVNPTITKVDNIGLDNDYQDTRATSFGDYDGDGYVDMFIPNYQIDSVSFLYHNNGDGTFTKVTDANNPIITDLAPSTSGVWGDYDNDGDIDLFVANNIGYGNFLYRNEGNGTFVSILNDPIVNYTGYSHGAAWADYDNDGYLDMFIADFFSTRFNKLYHNNGDGTFTEIKSSPLVTDASFSISAVWADYDNDKDQDLFVANTNGENNFLYRNDGNGAFTKITSGDIVNDGGKSTGASWGDYDNDLDLDLFVANAGSESNFLYQNNGDGTFTKITNSVVSLNGGHSHGSTWGDMDNDGYIDLIVGNDQGENNNMFLNNGDGTFTALNNEVTQDGGKSFGLALADIDNDCDLDLHVSNILNEANAMYINDLTGCNKKVCFTLVGTSANALAYGAKIKILATINGVPTWQMRELASISGGGFGGQNDSRVMFGLGDAAQVDSVYVEWASGYIQKLGSVSVNTYNCTTITEQNGAVVCGSVYFDDNNDCNYNGDDEGLEGIEIVAQPGNIKAYTDTYGDYTFNLAPGTYTITQTNTNVWTASCSASYTINVAGIGQQYCGNDFANTMSCPNPDLFIDLSTTALRVGFENLYAITFGNNGAVAANNATVKVDFGAHIIPLTASLPWDSKSGTEYTWNIGIIELGQEFTIYVEDSVLTTATIGNNIAVLGTIDENGSTANDCDVANNIETDINLAVGAIDPNDIQVSPEGFIANDQELTYKIRFQNVGNDLVNRVVLRDELPEGLDLSTLVRGVASHAYQFRLEGERTLVWEFNNINLLDSTTNKAESHGFVTFKITPQVDLADGTELANKAAIFFDNSDPILTNTVINTIGEPTEVKPGDVGIYPNPMTNFTTIRIVPRQLGLNEEEIQTIEIYTMLGHQILSINSLTGTKVTIERGELASGYYIVRVKSNKGTLYTGKLLVRE